MWRFPNRANPSQILPTLAEPGNNLTSLERSPQPLSLVEKCHFPNGIKSFRILGNLSKLRQIAPRFFTSFHVVSCRLSESFQILLNCSICPLLSNIPKPRKILPYDAKSWRIWPNLCQSCKFAPHIAKSCQIAISRQILHNPVKSCQIVQNLANVVKSCQKLRNRMNMAPQVGCARRRYCDVPFFIGDMRHGSPFKNGPEMR